MFPFVGQAGSGGGGDIFLAVGGSGSGSTRAAYTTTSTDGISWSSQGPTINLPSLGVAASQYNCVTWSEEDNRFILGGIQQVSMSMNGSTLDGLALVSRDILGIHAARSGIYLANGGLNTNFTYAPPAGGGADFWAGPVAMSAVSVLTAVYAYAYAPSLDRWVAASSRGELLTSTGTNVLAPSQGGSLGSGAWSIAASGLGSQRDVIWCDSISTYLACGNAGGVRRSTDGTTWALGSSRPGTPVLYGAAWSGSLAVVVGAGGTIWTSSDLDTWTARTSGTAAILYDVTYSTALGLFVACGAAGTLLTSPDGVTWTPRVSGVPDPLYAITCTTEPD